MSPHPNTLLLSVLAIVGTYLLFFRTGPYSAHSLLSSAPSTMSAHSASGWHARARPHPSVSRASFAPTLDALEFAVLLNAQIEHDGFELALLRPDTAVDARGAILQLAPEDFARLAALAREANALPDSGDFMNAWRVEAPRTEQPIERLFVRAEDGGVRETSVQGWHKDRTKLKKAAAGHEDLPAVLQELFEYVQEAKTGYQRGEEDKDVVNKVKDVVPH